MNKPNEYQITLLLKEVRYKTTRSAGSGGQHVNKVETRVSLIFDVGASDVLTEEQKKMLFIRQKNRINKEGLLLLHCDTERSQLSNKKKVQERFINLLKTSFKQKATRKKTGISRSQKEERLKKKKQLSEKKQRRQFNFRDRFNH